MGFSILHQNICSLISHGQEFKYYVCNLEIKPDIICLQETFLKPHLDFTMPGYAVIRSDRDGNRGGLAMLVKHGIAHNIIALPEFKSVECQCVQVTCQNNKNVSIFNIYYPCNKLCPYDFEILTKLSLDSTVYCGDFNSHNTLWGSSLSD